MDNFRDLVEANLGSLASAAGEAVADTVKHGVKQGVNGALAGLGSARATGRLDLNAVANDVMKKWKYFYTTQQAGQTVEAFVDFVKTVYGLPLGQEDIYTAIYGFDPMKSPKPPQIMAPNQAVLKDYFKVIFAKTATQPRLLKASQDLVRYAENNEADQNYIVLMLKWLGAKAPDMLTRAGMEPLKAYAHGGNLNKDDLTKIIRKFASLILKQMMVMRREDEEKAAKGGTTDADGDGKPDAPADGGDTVASTPEALSMNPPSTQEQGNWGGLKRPAATGKRPLRAEIAQRLKSAPPVGVGFKSFQFEALAAKADDETYWENFANAFESLNFRKLNAMSAQLMYVIGRIENGTTPQSFASDVMEFQRNVNLVVWPAPNAMAAYTFARLGGNFDEITAELNHFANNSLKASKIATFLWRYIAKSDAKAGAPAPAPAAGDAAA